MYETPSLTVDCVVFDSNGVVLIRRGHEPFEGWYALPGGFVEIGETVEQACAREIKEETGLEINEEELHLIGVYSDPNRDPRRHTVSVAFLGRSSLDKLQAGDDASSVEVVKNWRDKDIAFDHKKILEDAWRLYKNEK
ncbi:MAG: NUDIX hydrolase [Candidatus Competibacter sp.]